MRSMMPFFFVCLLMGALTHVTLLGVSGGICAGIYSLALSLIRPVGARLMPGHIFLGSEGYAERMHIVCNALLSDTSFLVSGIARLMWRDAYMLPATYATHHLLFWVEDQTPTSYPTNRHRIHRTEKKKKSNQKIKSKVAIQRGRPYYVLLLSSPHIFLYIRRFQTEVCSARGSCPPAVPGAIVTTLRVIAYYGRFPMTCYLELADR